MSQSQIERPRRLDLVLSPENRDALDCYRATHAEFFDAEVAAPEFHGRFEKVDLSGAVLGRARTVGQTFRRTRTHTRRNGVDHVMLIHDAKGSWSGDYDGRSARGGPGCVRLVDLSRPFANTTTDYDAIGLTFPRKALGAEWANRDIHGLVLNGQTPGLSLLTSHLRALYKNADTLSLPEAAAGAQAAGVLLTGALLGQAHIDDELRTPIEATLRAMAHDYIERNLADPELAPAAISAHLRVSLRTLYRMFEAKGGVTAHIQARRLDRAYDAIVRLPDRRLPIAEISYAHGFVSESHFSRVFLARFGVRPGDLRSRGAGSAGRDAGEAGFGRTLLGWFHRI